MATPESTSLIAQYQPLIQVALGGALTFFGGYFGTKLVEERKNKRDAKSLAYAFRGELLAIRTIVNEREYFAFLERAIEYIKTTNQPWTIRVNIRQKYFNVFEKNVDKLGLLPNPLPEKIATFYTQANSILEDIQTANEGGLSEAAEVQLRAYEQLHALLFKTMKLIDDIVQEVERAFD